MVRSAACRGAAVMVVLLPLAGQAEPMPKPGSFDFPTGNFDFPAGTFSFGVGSADFPGAGIISFPSSLMPTETATTIEVTLPADVLFDFDKADIRPDAAAAMKEVAQLIRDKARGPVAIQGFTDALGNDGYNQKLSERRAASVKTWLVSREGLGSTAFTTAGFGPRNPVAPNRKPDGTDDPDARQRNRRVTLIIKR